jgi:hypothetical protein
MHWFSHQVTILIHLTYRLNPFPDPEVRGSKWIKESHFYILDDKEHDHCSFSIAFYFTGSGSVTKDSNQDNIGYSVMDIQPNSRGHSQCTLLHATLDLRMDVL